MDKGATAPPEWGGGEPPPPIQGWGARYTELIFTHSPSDDQPPCADHLWTIEAEVAGRTETGVAARHKAQPPPPRGGVVSPHPPYRGGGH